MNGGTFRLMDRTIPFRTGESIAVALQTAGVLTYGPDALGNETRYFCGIGACQCCLVRVDGVVREACITPARPGMNVEPVERRHG
jgi:aerobic-type carbon monoxide dehydrogenase small subunit (CoxS/CutS family)